ncbi:hypothetical protein [Sphingomonas sp.]|uniref:hypothetical protein n=1 Tax=Sphingomonas sp. TaxID=28214 RepID=UPI0031D50659
MSDTPAHRLPPDAASGGVRHGHIDLPVVLLAALDAAGTSVEAFLARLERGSIWQDSAIRSADRAVVIQAYLAPDGLRAVVQIGNATWYHYPSDKIHAWGVVLPATIMATRDVPLKAILRHPLLDPLPLCVRAIRDLNTTQSTLGVSIQLDVPALTVSVSPDSRRPGPASAAPNPGN